MIDARPSIYIKLDPGLYYEYELGGNSMVEYRLLDIRLHQMESKALSHLPIYPTVSVTYWQPWP